MSDDVTSTMVDNIKNMSGDVTSTMVDNIKNQKYTTHYLGKR